MQQDAARETNAKAENALQTVCHPRHIRPVEGERAMCGRGGGGFGTWDVMQSFFCDAVGAYGLGGG